MKVKNNPLMNQYTLGASVFFFAVLALILAAQKAWGNIAQVLCIVYAVFTGLFFLAQLYGFIISQTEYSDEIEAPKFLMLENEEAQWKKSKPV